MSKPVPDPELQKALSRAETLTGALLYMMTAYQRTPCPCLAGAIARHLECLACHPSTAPVVRDVCTGLFVQWQATARAIAHEVDVGTGTQH